MLLDGDYPLATPKKPDSICVCGLKNSFLRHLGIQDPVNCWSVLFLFENGFFLGKLYEITSAFFVALYKKLTDRAT